MKACCPSQTECACIIVENRVYGLENRFSGENLLRIQIFRNQQTTSQKTRQNQENSICLDNFERNYEN